MTSHPGDDPHAHDPAGGAEPTQPIGGWGDPGGDRGAAPAVGQPAWGPPAYPYATEPPYGGWGPQPVQDHPRATLSLILGVVALGGGLICGLPILASPFAWVIGGRTVREIRRSGGRYGGEGLARAGQVLGIVGTVLIVMFVLAVAFFVWQTTRTLSTDYSTNA